VQRMTQRRVPLPENTKDPAEHGSRISLTFRHIGTFLIRAPLSPSPSSPVEQSQAQVQQLIFGQGATGKTRAEARAIVHGGGEAEHLLAALGAENPRASLIGKRPSTESHGVRYVSPS
jgi:hypothetical protein